MGFISNWWNGTSSADAASAAAAADAPQHQRRSVDAKPNVWRSVFDPGSNPNVKNVGSSYYDTVKDKTSAPTTWDMILQGEATRRKSFSDLDANKDGFITRAELQAVAGKLDIGTIFAEADTNRDGKIDRREFSAVLEKYFQGRNT